MAGLSSELTREWSSFPDKALTGEKPIMGQRYFFVSRMLNWLSYQPDPAGWRRLDNYSRIPYYEGDSSGAFLFLSDGFKSMQLITGFRITCL